MFKDQPILKFLFMTIVYYVFSYIICLGIFYTPAKSNPTLTFREKVERSMVYQLEISVGNLGLLPVMKRSNVNEYSKYTDEEWKVLKRNWNKNSIVLRTVMSFIPPKKGKKDKFDSEYLERGEY